MQSSRKKLLPSVFGSILLWAAWPPSPLTPIIFVAWVPLLLVLESTFSWKRFFGYTYLHMLLWNLFITWWVAKASLAGGISAFLVNSLVMCVPWLLYYFTKKYIKGTIGACSIVVYWLAFEYLHQNWDLSWPWLTLGNVFATRPGWIQWYEYTGTSGGSVWILLSNILVFRVLQLYKFEGRSTRYFKNAAAWVIILITPILVSFFVKTNLTLLHNKYNVVVVQPNVDPWNEKFEAGKQDAQLQKLIAISREQIDENTALVVWPETAIPFQSDETRLRDDRRLVPLWAFLKQNPQINLLTGLEGYKQFNHKVSRYAQPITGSNDYYEAYNSALLLDSNQIQIYHKSKLVPGAEVLPWFVSFLAPAFEKFGGTTGGYARDSSTRDFPTFNHSFNITPAICYESIYGDYLSKFNRQGSNIICVITNDGWWGNTQGYKQHLNYARLRAIESRKWVARSANTGVSCFIDPYGNIIQQLPWNTQGSLKQKIPAYITETFFTRYGDLLSILFCILAPVLFIFSVIKKFILKTKNTKYNAG